MWNTLISRGRRLASSLFSAVYPSTCPLCTNPSDALLYAPICTRCWESMVRYSGPSCRVCAAPLVSEHSTVCGDCLSHPPPFSSVLNFGLYSGSLSEAIHLLKFSGLKRLAKPLGKLLTELPIPTVDGIVPVPVTKRTLRTRGFNQALLLSVVLSRHIRIPVYMDMLYKKKDTPAQIGLGAK
ncbi:MAG TPA: double zinc ribbon domain-containing protein, partial [Thermodesulfovibrionales bacterium]|nr:double zinc ribbon domain-containing protein [Thermodesulfovibrionales bacterium]